MGKDPHYSRAVFQLDPNEPAWPLIPAVLVMVAAPVMDLRTNEPEEAGS